MRKKIIVGNWKMHHTLEETQSFIQDFLKIYTTHQSQSEIIIAPAYPFLHIALQMCKNSPLHIAAQNMHEADQGAYTGEVSAAMLRSIGVRKVILGHSERRKYFFEIDEILARKVTQALKHELEIIFCIGETLTQRNREQHFDTIKTQLEKKILSLSPQELQSVIIAYEPIWAIGTEQTATPDQTQEMHAYIRQIFSDKYGKDIASELRILYGGSVKPTNSQMIFYQKDIDGGLIGGASLKPDDFIEIIRSC
ncbi:MAG: triose-phosphate isomerase [Flavobacteriales bacterium Tduv]